MIENRKSYLQESFDFGRVTLDYFRRRYMMAYIDPNTGGMLFQLLATSFALLSGVVLIFSRQIRAGFARFKRYVRKLMGRDDVSTPTEE